VQAGIIGENLLMCFRSHFDADFLRLQSRGMALDARRFRYRASTFNTYNYCVNYVRDAIYLHPAI
jgi:hypothetical protein